MNFFIDTHSHIYYDQYKNDLPAIIDAAKQNNVEKIPVLDPPSEE